jgi:hypothetical protein
MKIILTDTYGLDTSISVKKFVFTKDKLYFNETNKSEKYLRYPFKKSNSLFNFETICGLDFAIRFEGLVNAL